MKIKFTLLLLLTIIFSSNAQEVPFGDFENWTDVSADFNAELENPLEPKTILFPEDCTPVLSMFFLLFVLDLEEVVNNSSQDKISTNLLNIARTTDSHGGNYAMKLGGSAHNAFAHIQHASELKGDELPKSLSFYYKHVGNVTDTLYVISTIASEEALVADSIDFEITRAQIVDSIISETTEGYIWKQIEVEDVNLEAASDTFNFEFYFLKDEPDSTSYWIIDNVQWNIETPTYDVDHSVLFRLGQSIDNQTIYPFLDQSKYAFKSAAILSENGAKIKSYNEWSDEINITELNPGRYVFMVEANGRIFSKLFIKY